MTKLFEQETGWMSTRALGLAALWVALAACQSDADEGEDAMSAAAAASLAYGDWGDPLKDMPVSAEQLQSVCSRVGNDIVRDAFCASDAAPIGSLLELENALGVGPNATPGVTGVALTGNSTALSARSVSAINPRVIMFRLDVSKRPPEMVSLSFNRGDQTAEIVAFDREQREFAFYVVRFEQACNEDPEGCRPGHLLSEAVETDWQNVTLYDEPMLSNTVLDCATCHQPEGPGTPKMLRMQEIRTPWTHWFFNSSPGGKALIDDYNAAKGDESVGGLDRDKLFYTSPGGLELFVGSRNHDQPNAFDSEAIEREVQESAAASGGDQPVDNRVAGDSPTWRASYERAQRGEAIPVPYHDVKVTDSKKLERATEAYQAYRAGDLAREALPDIRDIYPDDPKRLSAMGVMTEPGASGEAVLVEACSTCHNDRLDQELSRARFNPDLSKLSREEKELAIQRLSLPANNVRAMPPARLRVLSAEAKAAAIEAIRRSIDEP